MPIPKNLSGTDAPAAWSAVLSLALGVFSLVMAEMLPASLLTPMAAALAISEGLAGQAVTATAIVGFVTSLMITTLAARVDRRHLLLTFSVLLIVANLLVASAPGLIVLLGGRLLLGFALGGFWTVAAATTMRLVSAASVPRALSIVFGGVAVATVVTGPLGSLLGALIGWRAVFLVGACVGLLSLGWQYLTLPPLPAQGQARFGGLVDILKRPQITAGLIAASLIFAGHMMFFTYLRPFLEAVTGVGVGALSAILLGFGIANVLGTAASGLLLARGVRFTLAIAPLGLALVGASLALWGGTLWSDAALVACWGFGFGVVPVAWTTWITRTAADQAERASGLLVAAIQLAIALGAGIGGLIVDLAGNRGAFAASAGVLMVAVTLVLRRLRPVRG